MSMAKISNYLLWIDAEGIIGEFPHVRPDVDGDKFFLCMRC